jgi:hypothetical protein
MQDKRKLIGIGTEIRLLTTNDTGIVIEKLGDGMVMVRLYDRDANEIPVFEEDLVRLEDMPPAEKNKAPQSEQRGFAKPVQSTEAQHPIVDIFSRTKLQKEAASPFSVTDNGLAALFVPHRKNDGEILHFDGFLFNDSHYDLVFDLTCLQAPSFECPSRRLKSGDLVYLGEILFDQLNDQPECVFSVTPLSTEGSGALQMARLKLKPRTFIKAPAASAFENIFGTTPHVFVLIEKLRFQGAEKEGDSLRKHAQGLVSEQKKAKKQAERARDYNDALNPWRVLDPIANTLEVASFEPEIDLHIELIHPNHNQLSSAEIVQFQLKTFDAFLERAIRLGIPRVFIIHGVGTGRLKEMVSARLRRNEQVRAFKNEYHAKYGWGATEVHFSKW